jgi:hypothetical protein
MTKLTIFDYYLGRKINCTLLKILEVTEGYISVVKEFKLN